MDQLSQFSQDRGVVVSKLCQALAIPRASYYRHQKPANVDKAMSEMPANALGSQEKRQILDLLHSERFMDQTPYQMFYTLLDEGLYYASIRTIYRLLAEQGESQDRRIQRSHRDAVKPELIASRPNEVWSWDITKLLTCQRLVYFHLYVVLDIYSRLVVGWLLADRECKRLACRLVQQSALKQGIQPGQLTLHADNGPSMRSQSLSELLEHLGVIKTHNRPYTSNDNPFSESQFKTLKYCPEFPGRFESLAQAEQFCQQFFVWYNQQHYHSGIAWLIPESVHLGQAETILAKRHQALLEAYARLPARFNHQSPVCAKLKPVYINPPQTVVINSLQEVKNMA